MKIVIVTDPDREGVAQVHLRHRLVKTKAQEFFLPLKESSEEYLKLLDEDGQRLVRALAELAGVTRIAIGSYCVTLRYGPAFEWQELEGPVVEVIFRTLGYDDDTQVELTTFEELYGK